MSTVDAAALRVARQVSRELTRDGAIAVVLTGSHALGHTHPESDIDLIALSARRDLASLDPHEIRRSGSFLLTVSAMTPAAARAAFRDPSLVPTSVPGWRDAIILADNDSVAARIQAAASRWTWDAIAESCDEWVAEQVAGYAEEVHKLVGALRRGDDELAAVQRSILALHLAKIAAVHHRILYGSENALWRLVSERMGPAWASAQASALALDAESVTESSRAALSMYVMLARATRGVLNRQQRAVVEHACSLASGVARGARTA